MEVTAELRAFLGAGAAPTHRTPPQHPVPLGVLHPAVHPTALETTPTVPSRIAEPRGQGWGLPRVLSCQRSSQQGAACRPPGTPRRSVRCNFGDFTHQHRIAVEDSTSPRRSTAPHQPAQQRAEVHVQAPEGQISQPAAALRPPSPQNLLKHEWRRQSRLGPGL